jgi:hypothetical protein
MIASDPLPKAGVPGSRQQLYQARAAVLTLWSAVVAEELGFDRGTALILGQAVAGSAPTRVWKAAIGSILASAGPTNATPP